MKKQYQRKSNDVYACATINGVEYRAYYTDTKYYGGLAWLIETSKGGQRLYPSTCAPEWAIRHWASGYPPLKKTYYT